MQGWQIVLEYLRVFLSSQVVVGVVAIIFTCLFRKQIGYLIARIATIRVPGGEPGAGGGGTEGQGRRVLDGAFRPAAGSEDSLCPRAGRRPYRTAGTELGQSGTRPYRKVWFDRSDFVATRDLWSELTTNVGSAECHSDRGEESGDGRTLATPDFSSLRSSK